MVNIDGKEVEFDRITIFDYVGEQKVSTFKWIKHNLIPIGTKVISTFQDEKKIMTIIGHVGNCGEDHNKLGYMCEGEFDDELDDYITPKIWEEDETHKVYYHWFVEVLSDERE